MTQQTEQLDLAADLAREQRAEEAKMIRLSVAESMQREINRRCFDEGVLQGLEGVTGCKYPKDSPAYGHFDAGWQQGFAERKQKITERQLEAQARAERKAAKQARHKQNQKDRAEANRQAIRAKSSGKGK